MIRPIDSAVAAQLSYYAHAHREAPTVTFPDLTKIPFIFRNAEKYLACNRCGEVQESDVHARTFIRSHLHDTLLGIPGGGRQSVAGCAECAKSQPVHHDPHGRCESGGFAHCTCDRCF